jgi:preprotein translocase subunit SecE
LPSVDSERRGCIAVSQATFDKATMARTSPIKFLQEVRAEGQKVTWPTRRETAITTLMVFIMTAAASVFFLLSDMVMRQVITFIIGWSGTPTG